MELNKPSRRDLLVELKHATESLRRLARLIALMPDPQARSSAPVPRIGGQNEGLLRTLGIGDLRPKLVAISQRELLEQPAACPPPSTQVAADDDTERARGEIARIFADRLHPYFHRHDLEHHQAVERMRALFNTAYGND